MRRPSPAPAPPPAPPRRRSDPGAPPPMRAGARASAPPQRPAAGAPPRPAPPRPPGPARRSARPTRARPGRRSVVLATLLTVAVLAAYGGVTAWNSLVGDDGTPPVPTGRGFVPSTTRAIQHGQVAVLLGVNLRLLADVYYFRDDMNRLIDGVRTERVNLERVAARAPAARAGIARSAVDATARLELAMIQWRDAIFLTQLGRVDAAQSGIDAAVAQLEADRTRWTAGKG